MFYSQFILAKKGPLGTIWIAAHLERKLRKNQVADTDIGVSVDSILSPDVPIALRLSSHLLLGVVRIYNKKVGYLFDDCSEALLKVKQTFRSTAVDLPPEESKAPYHSITLPEKFDLDDFELPDSDIFQGNYVDHHISSREQITLQDTMEGVSYSTSKFGLDERFGDGDVSGLDLEEELLLGNIGFAEHGDERLDLHASFGSTSAIMQDQHPEDRAADSEAMVDGGDECTNILVYSHAPNTPRLVDEPVFLKFQEASACDDHLESEYHLTGSSIRKNMDRTPCENKQELECSKNDAIPDAVPEENGHLSGSVEVKESELQGQIDSIKPPSECKESEAFNEDMKDLVSIDEAHCNDHGSNDVEVPFSKAESSNQQKSCHAVPELASEDQDALILASTEMQACQGTDVASVNLDAHDKDAATETIVLRPRNSIFIPSNDGDVKSDICVEATNGGEETAMLGQVHCVNDTSEHNQVEHNPSGEDTLVAAGESNGLAHGTAKLPAPEKLLSVLEGHMDQHSDLIMGVSPMDFEGLDEGHAGSKIASGRKRTFTESTLTEQSLNSVESSRKVRIKRTAGSVPDDDDLLSSILVGRNTSILRVKPTPPPSEVTSMKRSRAAPRSGAPKRKVLMDDTMVLHGDSIREQLTHAEDIRRVRKKAPCTLSEISMIRKQHMEDETFLVPVFTGMSVELTSLHDQVYDLGRINLCKTEVHDASLETLSEHGLPSQDDENRNFLENMVEPSIGPSAYLETMVEFHSISSNNRSHDVEDDKRPGTTNVTEVSGQVLDDEFLTVRGSDNETAEPCENCLPTENKIEEVDYTSTAVNEEWKPTTDRDTYDSLVEHTAMASDGVIQTASANESEGTNAHVNTEAAGILDQSNALPSTELDFADVDYEQATTKGKEKDENGGESEIELGLKDDILPDMTHDAATELIPYANHGNLEYHVESQNRSTTSKELLDEEFPCTGLESMLQGVSINTRDENPDHPDVYQIHMMDGEVSGFDLHDPDELSYLAAGNDTEFLNVDDDDLSEMADDSMPDAEDTQYSENSGWSSRTRAVSKYLQAAFVIEADSGRSSLSLENLLIGKSRKEASRMFFETLVLKTRDYIHVEQRNPFGDTTIRPRTRLMKSHL